MQRFFVRERLRFRGTMNEQANMFLRLSLCLKLSCFQSCRLLRMICRILSEH